MRQHKISQHAFQKHKMFGMLQDFMLQDFPVQRLIQKCQTHANFCPNDYDYDYGNFLGAWVYYTTKKTKVRAIHATRSTAHHGTSFYYAIS